MQVQIDVPGFKVEESGGVLHWQGRDGVVGFIVAPASSRVTPGAHLGTVRILISGMPIASVYFKFEVGSGSQHRTDCTADVRWIESAFASYASQERDEVLARVQGMQKILPMLNVFLDVISLRSGQEWQQRIPQEIQSRDAFFLFWSRAASRSQWVDYEWRTALSARGLEFIDPVPIEEPALAPPPSELASRHFGDWTLAVAKRAPS